MLCPKNRTTGIGIGISITCGRGDHDRTPEGPDTSKGISGNRLASPRSTGTSADLAAYKAGGSLLWCSMTPSRDISRLIEIMAQLRTPVTGCPWDLEQNFETIAPYTIEEAYEVADAIARGDLDDLRDELGDLLLQVVYHARMAEEQNAFSFGDVVETLTQKLIRRHPHVFGDEQGHTAEAVKGLWDRIKAEEKAARGVSEKTSALAGVPV